jgi:hypothetical protein
VATGTLLTTRVTVRLVPFWIERLIARAGTVPSKSDADGSAATPGEAAEAPVGVGTGPGVAQPARRAQSKAIANVFIVT